jgi:putative nucleotidyltransferase with HDIG domain
VIKVLFVDDEPRVLEGLRRSLRRKSDWEIHTSDNPVKALEQIEQGEFQVVVSDMRMPQMTGAVLLDRIASSHPKIVRFILSGQCDNESILNSVTAAHQFLSKPCDIDELVRRVDRACGLRRQIDSTEIAELVSKLVNLPSLPRVYKELIDVLNRDKFSLAEVVQVVENDPPMAAKILQLSNSAFFGSRNNVSSIANAVSILGAESLKSLALVTGVFNSLQGTNLSEYEKCWEDSGTTSTIALRLAETFSLSKDHREALTTAALIHDIGKLILLNVKPEEYSSILRDAREDRNLALWELERTQFGATHADLGAYLLASWGLPDPIVEAVTFHAEPWLADVKFPELPLLLFLAESIAECSTLPQAWHRSAFEYVERLGLIERLESLQSSMEPQ